MISHKHGFLFLHVGRTGGNSISNVLMHHSENETRVHKSAGRGVHDPDGAQGISVLDDDGVNIKHYGLSYFVEKMGERVFDYFIFLTARNPWDRLVSGWHYSGKRMPFDEFISRGPVKPCVENFLTVDGKVHDPSYVIRFERLQEGLDHVCEHLGLPKTTLPHVNRSSRGHYAQYYSDVQRALVAQRYAKDIEYFDYRFDD